MVDDLLSAIHARQALVDAQLAQPTWGLVSDVNADTHQIKVTIQPEGILTGWLPLPTLGIGNGGGVRVIPTEGMMAICTPDGNDANNYIVHGFASNEQDKHPDCPNAIGGGPAKGTAGEAIMVTPGGNGWVRLCADGSLLLGSKTGINIDGNVHISGDVIVDKTVTATGNITSKADVADKHNTVDHLRQTYNTHLHNGVQSGSAVSGKPTTQD